MTIYSIWNIIILSVWSILKGLMKMREFKIPMKSKQTTNKTIRFPDDLIEEIEKALVCKNCTFTAFVIAAVRYALANKESAVEEQKKTD